MNKLSTVIHCRRDKEYKYRKILVATLDKKLTIKEAAIAAGVSSHNIHRMVNKLKGAGCIKKVFGGRTKYIAVTEKGIQILEDCGGGGCAV